jgi:hypothetical protein
VAIVTLPPFIWPRLVDLVTVGTSVGLTSIACATADAANEKVACIFQSPVAGSFTDFAVRTQTVSVTSGPLNFDFRLETVTAGLPSGSLFGTNSNATVSVATTDDNVWKTGTLTTPPTVAVGDYMAIVVKAPGAGTFSFTWGGFGTLTTPTMFPVCRSDTAADGTYATLASNRPSFAIKIGGSWYGVPPFFASDSVTLTAFGTGSSPNEYALRFVPDFTMRVAGAAVYVSNVGGNFKVSLWPTSVSGQTDANALAQTAVSSAAIGNNTNDGGALIMFAAPVTLTAGTTYELGVRAEVAGTLIVPSTATWSTAGTNANPGGPNNHLATRTWTAGTAGVWTPTTTSTPHLGLYVDGLDSGGAVASGTFMFGGV